MNSDRYRFGIFEFCARDHELRRDGEVARLQAQPAQVLGFLLKRAGQVVSREELQREVWGGDTFVDFDRGLNFCMAQIRSALGDDSTAPRFIRTIPKRGYQFIAPVIAPSETAEKAAEPAEAGGQRGKFSVTWMMTGVFAAALLLGIVFAAGYRLKAQQTAKSLPVVAVVRFDNETADPDMTRFSDGLTDSVVERLTSAAQGHYKVIGNAHILRRPRDERDLKAIAVTLGAGYVVLGQVQSDGGQTRVLAHLIRSADQTHIWVVRVDRVIGDPLSAASEVAEKVADELSTRVARDASGIALPEAPSH